MPLCRCGHDHVKEETRGDVRPEREDKCSQIVGVQNYEGHTGVYMWARAIPCNCLHFVPADLVVARARA